LLGLQHEDVVRVQRRRPTLNLHKETPEGLELSIIWTCLKNRCTYLNWSPCSPKHA
jgi:hypothetical protein